MATPTNNSNRNKNTTSTNSKNINTNKNKKKPVKDLSIKCRNENELKLMMDFYNDLKLKKSTKASVNADKALITKMMEMMENIAIARKIKYSQLYKDLYSHLKLAGYFQDLDDKSNAYRHIIHQEISRIEQECEKDGANYMKDLCIIIEKSSLYEEYRVVAKKLDGELFEIYKRNAEIARYAYNFGLIPGQIIWYNENFDIVSDEIANLLKDPLKDNSNSLLDKDDGNFNRDIMSNKDDKNIKEDIEDNKIRKRKKSSVGHFVWHINSNYYLIVHSISDESKYVPPEIDPSVWLSGTPPTEYVKYHSPESFTVSSSTSSVSSSTSSVSNSTSSVSNSTTSLPESDITTSVSGGTLNSSSSPPASCIIKSGTKLNYKSIAKPAKKTKVKTRKNVKTIYLTHGDFINSQQFKTNIHNFSNQYKNNNYNDCDEVSKKYQLLILNKYLNECKANEEISINWKNCHSLLEKYDIDKLSNYGQWDKVNVQCITKIGNKPKVYRTKNIRYHPILNADSYLAPKYFQADFSKGIKSYLDILPYVIQDEIIKYLNMITTDPGNLNFNFTLSLECHDEESYDDELSDGDSDNNDNDDEY